ncbi:MAG: MFS transporter [Eubacteriales bacterium]|jgi:Na+/melibiose symporter-like transporter
MKKVKDPNRVRFTDYLGVTLMSMTDCIAAGLMTSWFMTYLTDYAGLGTWAALLGSVLLICMRLFDAVNDPLEGWLMDRAKVGKLGKYKPFIMISILFEMAGLSALFFIPAGITGTPALVVVWVVVAYVLYDIGASFFAPNLVYRMLTLDSAKRGKLMIAPRMMSMIMGMVTGSIISIVTGVNASIGNMHTAFGVTVMAAAIGTGVISLIGIAMVKEKHHTERDANDPPVKITDIFLMFKENKALSVKFVATIFSGFIWTFLFATMTYYIKWAYCADLATGAVDAEKFGLLSLIGSMMMLMPLLLGTAIAMPIMKIFKTPVRTYRFVIVMEAVPCGIMFVLQMLGILQTAPAIFLTLVAIAATAIGIGYIPNEALNIEIMDYQIYKNGKDRSAQVNATAKFLDKAQNAVSGGLVGIVLVAVGYVVDSATGDYAGDLANIPGMLNWFIVIMGLVPCILAVISLLVYRKYPITPELAATMKAGLDGQKAAEK